MFRLVCLAIGYIIGCWQSAYFIGLLMHMDIRKYGSGNLGSTNVLRVLGVRAGLATFASDILKSVLAFILVGIVFKNQPASGIYACAGVILGHDFPFYLHFKGGKGIAAMIGLVLCLGLHTPLFMAFSFGMGILGLLTRYVSVGSMLFAVTVPVAAAVFQFDVEFVAVLAVLGALAVYQHRTNIKRLLAGNENKLGAKKKGQGDAP